MKFMVLVRLLYFGNIEGQLIYSAVYKFIIGFSVPVNIESPGHNLGWLINLQGLYRTPDNITYFLPHNVLGKRSLTNHMDRPAIYKFFVNYFNSPNGKTGVRYVKAFNMATQNPGMCESTYNCSTNWQSIYQFLQPP